MSSLHSPAVLSSNVAKVMNRENNSLAETMAVIGCSDVLIVLTADSILLCNSCTVSTVSNGQYDEIRCDQFDGSN